LLKTLDFDPGASVESIAQSVRSVWAEAKVVHIRGPEPSTDLRDYYWAFFNQIGEPLPIAEDIAAGGREAQRTGGYWFEVRYVPGAEDAYRHSANAQPLHTDMSYIPIPSAVGFLCCVAMTGQGGATTFVDSADVIEALKSEAPELLAGLENTVLPHARSGDRRSEKVVRYRETDGQPLLNWNYYCVDPELNAASQELREAFHKFLASSPTIQARTQRVKLAPGEAVMWKDELVLHGRDSFDASKPSERFLWKSGLLVAA
jgi:alpha-ketoglutarate-dependent taurine dioxygenase